MEKLLVYSAIVIFACTFWFWALLAIILSPSIMLGYLLNRRYQILNKDSLNQNFMYVMLKWIFPQQKWKFMNYGFAELTKNGYIIKNLKKEYELERYPLQLYHYLISSFNFTQKIKDKKVLEIGCKRGGGINYIKEQFNPQCCYGLEDVENLYEFCQQNYEDVQFYKGKLNELNSLICDKFDFIFLIEYNFKNIKDELIIIKNSLQEAGFIIYADIFKKSQLKQVKEQILQSDLVFFVSIENKQ